MSKFDIQKLMWPWKWGQGHQNLIISSHVSVVFRCKFGQNPPVGSGGRVQTRLIFTVFIVWWPWKLGHGHKNLINSFNYPSDTIYKVWPQSIIWLKRWSADIFWSKFDIQSAGVTLKIRSMSPKSNHFFPMSQWCFCASLVKIHRLVQEVECRQGSFLQSL